MKVYVLSFNPLALPTAELMSYLDTRPEILNWYTPFVGTCFIVTNYNRTALANLLAEKFQNQYFLVNEANIYSTDGRLLLSNWDFIQNPKSSGRWEQSISGIASALLGNTKPN